MMIPKANLTNWHKDATSKPDRLKTILDKARDTVKILDQDVDYQPQPTHRLSAFLSGQPSTIIGQKCKNCTGCLHHCVSYDGPQPKWRPELAALRRKPRNQAMLSYYFFCYCLSLFCFKSVLIALLLVISSSMACAISSRETRKVRHP